MGELFTQNLTGDDELRLLQEKYQNTLERDALTGVYNRRGFYTHTYTLIHENADISYDICCINIDKFKLVNDIFGNTEGDKLLNYIAKRLRSFAENKGTTARLTADNFAICVPHTATLYESLANQLSEWLSDYPLPIQVVTRCGFYFIHDIEIPISIMCDRANMAIMEIKGNYETKYSIYDDRIRKRIIEEQEIVNDMKFALEDEQFTVYYQPKVNMENGKLVGSEALVRWQHPEKGMISPGAFIPVFEKNGFVAQVDKYVWEHVCIDIRRWLDEGYSVCPVSINVSRAELYNKSLVNELANLVKKYNIPIDLLQLEITESAYMENPDQLINTVWSLKDAGFTLLMDDFGSGYSSLNILKDVPVDVLKLDLKFLYDMDHNIKANYILKSVIQMAMRLELHVIAEGVETEEQAQFLMSIGCNNAQGYFYARPMPKSGLEEYLKNPDMVDPTDGSMKMGLVNIDDLMSGFHRDDEVEWYRSAVIQMKAKLFEYDINNDIFTLYDAQLEGGAELVKMEIPNYVKNLKHSHFVHAEDADQILNVIESRKNIEGLDARIIMPGRGNNYYWYKISGRVLYTTDNKPTSYVGVLRDITVEKMSDIFQELLETFDSKNKDKDIIHKCAQIVSRGMMCDKVVLSYPQCGIRANVGGVIYSSTGGFRAIKDKKHLNWADSVLKKWDTINYGVGVIQRSEVEQNKFDIDDEYVFLEENEQTVVFTRLEISEGYLMSIGCVYFGEEVTIEDSTLRHFSEMAKLIGEGSMSLITNMQKKNDYDLLQSAFKTTGINIWEWHVDTGLLRRSDRPAEADGLGEFVENVPDSFIENGEIHPDFVEEYARAYRELASGRDAVVMVKKLHKDGIYHWLRINYHVIFDDDGIPVKAIGYGEDMEQIIRSLQNTREALQSNANKHYKTGSWFKADITEDKFIVWSGNFTKITNEYGYAETIRFFADNLVRVENREGFLRRLSPDSMIANYNEGDHGTCFIYGYHHVNDKTIHFREASVEVSCDERGHIVAFVNLTDMDRIFEYERKYASDILNVRDDVLEVYTPECFKQIVKGIIADEEDVDALMVIDMDRFALIMEAFGELYSQSIMQSITSIVKAILPDNAIIGKALSDRLCIYLPNVSERVEFSKIANHIQKSVSSVFTVENRNYVLSPSIGVSSRLDFPGVKCAEESGKGLYELIRDKAIERMMEAKELNPKM